MIKEMINELNRAMYAGEISFDCVHNILNQLSKLTGLEYCIINRRVAFKKGKEFHDAYVNA